MSWGERMFHYCERGQDASFWAEPANALTNIAFLVVAGIGLHFLLRLPDHRRPAMAYVLIALMFAIGIGSFLFHTFATGWAAIADVAPIVIFMLAYFGFALRQFAGLNMFWTLAGVPVFFVTIAASTQIKCWEGRVGFLQDVPAGMNAACLNGSVGYLPALAAMAIIGAYLLLKRHRAAPFILGATAVFAISVTFRWLDFMLCDTFAIAGKPIGTHFIWHLLNALTLFLLLMAVIFHGVGEKPYQLIPPRPKRIY